METKDVFFTWNDVKRLFRRKKNIYVRFFLWSFLGFLILYLSQPVRYEATAIFKQSTQDHQIKGQGELLISMLQTAASFSKEEGAAPLLTSRTLVREVVESLGLQIESKRFFLAKWAYHMRTSLLAELGYRPSPQDLFQFSSAKSETPLPISFFLRFQSIDAFEVLDSRKQLVGEGVLGRPVSCLDSTFQLDHIPPFTKKGKLYPFQIKPWTEVVKKMLSSLEVKASKKDKSILSLCFTFKEASKCYQFVNSLMDAYQKYLKRENEEISTVQKSYLEKRQAELMEEYEASLATHTRFLDENVEGSGFMTLKQESAVLEKPSEEYLERLYDLDLKLSRLKAGKQEKKEEEESPQDSLEKIYAKREKQLLQTDVKRKRIQGSETDGLLAFLSQKSATPFEGKIPKGLPSSFLQGIAEVQKTCKSYAGDPLVFLEIQQKKQRLKKQVEEEWTQKISHGVFHELEGISPETAQKLYVEYNEQLDALRVRAEQLREVKERILLPEFEIASLSELLSDGVSQEMIQKAGQRALELQDRANYSTKDVERIQSGLEVQKRFLQQHIEQILGLEQLKIGLVEEKIASLQQTSIHQLEVERELIQKQLCSLKERMKSFPGKWKKENELKMKRDLSLTIIEGLTQLAESKNIDAQLFYVGSKPIDLATFPYKPHQRMAFSFSILLALFLTLSLFTKDLLKWLSQGRVITESFAQSIGLKVCGFLHRVSSNQETLRNICGFLASSHKDAGGSCVLMLSDSLFFDKEEIARRLSLQGRKVLIVECFPEPVSPVQVGLYEYLSGPFEAPTVIQKEGFDVIPPGIYHPHFVEWLSLKKFKELVKLHLTSYDFVFLSMKGKASDASILPLKNLADLFILHVCDDVVWEEVAGWAQERPASLAVVFSK